MLNDCDMRWTALSGLGTSFAMLATLAACGGGSTSDSSADSSGHPQPILFTTAKGVAHYMALVSGQLRVNPRGCFAVDDQVLLAPYGTEVSEDGRGVRFPGVGLVKVGERISGAGGTNATLPSGGRACMVRGEHTTFVSVDPRY